MSLHLVLAGRPVCTREYSLRVGSCSLHESPPPNRPYTRPESGKKIAYKAKREGGAERFDDPAVQQTLAIDREWIPYYEQMRSALARFLLNTAKQHDAQTLSWLQTVPGLGNILRLVLRDDMPQLDRVPRGQDGASYGRRIPGATASGGTRLGTAGNTMGTAHRQWAFAEAATLFRRGNAPGPKSLAQLEKTPDTGKARSLRAHQLARAVSVMRKRTTACDLEQCLRTAGSRAGAPGAARDPEGRSQHRPDVQPRMAASLHADVRLGPIIPAPRAFWTRALALVETALDRIRRLCAAPPPRLRLTGERTLLHQPFAEDGMRGRYHCSVAEHPRHAALPSSRQ
jgi:hypothetical protein